MLASLQHLLTNANLSIPLFVTLVLHEFLLLATIIYLYMSRDNVLEQLRAAQMAWLVKNQRDAARRDLIASLTPQERHIVLHYMHAAADAPLLVYAPTDEYKTLACMAVAAAVFSTSKQHFYHVQCTTTTQLAALMTHIEEWGNKFSTCKPSPKRNWDFIIETEHGQMRFIAASIAAANDAVAITFSSYTDKRPTRHGTIGDLTTIPEDITILG